MGFGLIFPALLAIWLAFFAKENYYPAWRLTRIVALLLLLLTLILLYIDIPLRGIYLNCGGLFIFGFSCFLLAFLPGKYKARSLLAAALIAALVFLGKSGLLWPLEQYLSLSLPLIIFVCSIIAAASGSLIAAFTSVGLGVEIAGLIFVFSGNGDMGFIFFELFSFITAGAWLILEIITYFKQRRLTKRD